MGEQLSEIKNPNHPLKGSSIRVDPIRDLAALEAIKKNLAHKPRDLCLFTLGINTGYRANELLALTVGHVAQVKPGGRVTLKQSKTGQYRTVYLNRTCINAVQYWLEIHPNAHATTPLFLSRKKHRLRHGLKALNVSTVSVMVKQWCQAADLIGNYGSHSLRKTWGYHQRTLNNTSLALLMKAFGHASESQTMDYIGIEDEEIRKLYEMEL